MRGSMRDMRRLFESFLTQSLLVFAGASCSTSISFSSARRCSSANPAGTPTTGLRQVCAEMADAWGPRETLHAFGDVVCSATAIRVGQVIRTPYYWRQYMRFTHTDRRAQHAALYAAGFRASAMVPWLRSGR